jgi:HAD superfamily hydrolase (TIGR01509 family)
MKQLKAVIFDVDGTLAETERDGHRVAFNLAFSEHGMDWVWDEALYGELLAVTGGKERIRYFLSDFKKDYEYAGELDLLIKKIHVSKTKHYVSLLKNKAINLRPGVERLINELRFSNLRMAIATTTTPENVTALIKSTLGEHAIEWFDCIAAGDIVAAKKPASDIFDYCLEQLGLVADECLAIEDSAHGVRSSTSAGIPTLATINSYTQDDDFDGAISVVNHLGEVDLACETISGKTVSNSYINVDVLIQLHGQL